MDKTASSLLRGFFYGICLYVLTFVFFGFFITKAPEGAGWMRGLFLYSTAIAYCAAVLLPGWLFIWRAVASVSARGRWAWRMAAVSWVVLLHAILSVDCGILIRFGYHINGLVLNLLFTPGGFESMGLDAATMAPAIIVLLLYGAGHLFFMRWCLDGERAGRIGQSLFSRKAVRWSLIVAVVLSLGTSLLFTGLADFYDKTDVLITYETFPAVLCVRMRKMLKAVGLKQPARKPVRHFGGDRTSMNYPAAPIERAAEGPRMNVVWFVSESMRHDLLTAEIMPHVWQFASAHGHRFLRHYSGGNGTRMGMFSMFYSLHGANWDAFLRNRRGPLFIDWLLDDHAQLLCQTSAKFSYPEFDKTIFSAVPNECLRQTLDRVPWKSDILLVDNVVNFLKNRDRRRPFFVFGFFESTHAPYNFPEDSALRKEYMGRINYATVSAKDAPALYNRYANAAHHVDGQMGRVFDYLQSEPGLLENTIVVITGDHGEEFYEKGHLGHNSTYVDEQIHPPLVLAIPGMGTGVHENITHHTDIIPTIAPFMRVKNPPSDYSVGGNLLDPAYQRDYFVVMGWKDMVFVDEGHKFKLPVGGGNVVTGTGTDMQDQPLPQKEELMELHAEQLNRLQRDLMRFSGKKRP